MTAFTTAAPSWPPELRAAHAALLAAIASDPTGSPRCVSCAIALGAACRAARLSGRVTYALLRDAIGYRPRSVSTQEVVAVTSRDALMLLAIDAYYDVRT